jgi:hypothetical protein
LFVVTCSLDFVAAFIFCVGGGDEVNFTAVEVIEDNRDKGDRATEGDIDVTAGDVDAALDRCMAKLEVTTAGGSTENDCEDADMFLKKECRLNILNLLK